MERYFIEWCIEMSGRAGRMVPVDRLSALFSKVRNPGYTGVYWFKEADAQSIIASKSSSGLDQYEVTAERLVIDIDNGLEGLMAAEAKLGGLGYEVWSSGGKGFHIIIRHLTITSADLPYSHRKWVEEKGIDCDLSLYHAGHILSAPGRVHPRTKQKKQFVRKVEGEMAIIQLVKKPEIKFNFSDEGEELSRALMRLTDLSSCEPKPGNRHVSIWGVSRDMFRAGIDYEATVSIITKINSGWRNPKTDEELLAAIKQGYKPNV